MNTQNKKQSFAVSDFDLGARNQKQSTFIKALHCLLFLSFTFFTGLHASDTSSKKSSNCSSADKSECFNPDESKCDSAKSKEEIRQWLKAINYKKVCNATTATIFVQRKNEKLGNGGMNEESRRNIALWDTDSTLARDLDLTSYTQVIKELQAQTQALQPVHATSTSQTDNPQPKDTL